VIGKKCKIKYKMMVSWLLVIGLFKQNFNLDFNLVFACNIPIISISRDTRSTKKQGQTSLNGAIKHINALFKNQNVKSYKN
jgi:hypothetical protein